MLYPLLGTEPFILVNGDVWTTFDFASLLECGFGSRFCASRVCELNPTQHPKATLSWSNGRSYTFEQGAVR